MAEIPKMNPGQQRIKILEIKGAWNTQVPRRRWPRFQELQKRLVDQKRMQRDIEL